MEPKVYNFETPFDFGKHKGRTLRDVLKGRDGRYIGYLIGENILQFILDPTTMNELDKAGFFDDLEFPCYVSGGSIPLKDMGYEKEDIINEFKRRYDEFVKDPLAYEEVIKKRRKEFLNTKRNKERIENENENNYQINDDNEYSEPFQIGSSKDPSENPWLDILPDDEAETAYWNTQ
jgi:hypothetical protein